MITINSKDFKNGVSDSKFLGASGIVNLDIEKNIGALSVLNKMEKIGDFNDDEVKFVVKNNQDEFLFFVKMRDAINRYKVYILKTNNELQRVETISDGTILGVCCWENYFIYILKKSDGTYQLKHYERTNESLVEPEFEEKILIDNLEVEGDEIFSKMFVSKDNQVYFSHGEGNYIARFTKKVARDSNNADSDVYDILYNGDNIEYQPVALDLPKGQVVTNINELNYMYFACKNGDIFLWDRVSESFFSQVSTGVSPVIDSISLNNQLYFLGGLDATLFTTNSTNYQLIKDMNFLTEDSEQKYYGESANKYGDFAITDGLYIGLGKNLYDKKGNGIWKIKEGKKTFFELEDIEPTSDNLLNPDSWTEYLPGGKVSFLGTKNKGGKKYFIAVYNKITEEGVAEPMVFLTSQELLYKSGFFESGFYRIGDFQNEKKISNFEIYFSRKLKIGEGFKIEYRDSANEQYQSVGYFINKDDAEGGGFVPDDFEPDENAENIGAVSTYTNEVSLPPLSNIQFRLTLFTNYDNTESPEFLEIKFK